MIDSPLFIGLNPRLLTNIAFSISSSLSFSQGWIESVCESGVLTFAIWLSGVKDP